MCIQGARLLLVLFFFFYIFTWRAVVHLYKCFLSAWEREKERTHLSKLLVCTLVCICVCKCVYTQSKRLLIPNTTKIFFFSLDLLWNENFYFLFSKIMVCTLFFFFFFYCQQFFFPSNKK